MCIICIEFEKGKLKLGEAIRNYGEMKETLTEEHQINERDVRNITGILQKIGG